MTMKKFLAMLLAVAMLFCFAACGGSSDKDDDDKDSNKNGISAENKEVTADDVVGKWALDFDLTDMFLAVDFESDEDNEVVAAAINDADCVAEYIFEFDSNGTLKTYFEEDDIQKIKDNIIEGTIQPILEIAYEQLGMTAEEYEAAIAKNGLTLEDMKNQLRDQNEELIGDFLLEKVFDNAEAEDGKYVYEEEDYSFKNGKIYIDSDEDYIEVEFDGEDLKCIDVGGEAEAQIFKNKIFKKK